jgi:hypothetical protein
LSNWLGFGTHQTKFLFELSLPSIDINLTIIKNDSISCRSNHPTSCDENFSEQGVSKISPGSITVYLKVGGSGSNLWVWYSNSLD